jgi:AcrR family transcriptional regulator
MDRRQRMSGQERRQQVLRIAAEEFADGGLHGTSTEVIARRAEITQA